MVERGERLEAALKLIQRAVAADPGNPSYLDSLGWAYFKLGKFAGAEQPLLETARQLPPSPRCKNTSEIFTRVGKNLIRHEPRGSERCPFRQNLRRPQGSKRNWQDQRSKELKSMPVWH